MIISASQSMITKLHSGGDYSEDKRLTLISVERGADSLDSEIQINETAARLAPGPSRSNLDNAIHRETNCVIHRADFYPVDSATQRLNNRGQVDKHRSTETEAGVSYPGRTNSGSGSLSN